MVKSKKVYSPQSFVEALTGNCYIFDGECDILKEIHTCLSEDGVEDEENVLFDYPFTEIEHIVENHINVVLVDISGYGPEESWKQELRWFEVPDDFEEEKEEDE